MINDNLEVVSIEWGDVDQTCIAFNVIEDYEEFRYYVFADDPYPPHRQAFYDALNGKYGEILPFNKGYLLYNDIVDIDL